MNTERLLRAAGVNIALALGRVHYYDAAAFTAAFLYLFI